MLMLFLIIWLINMRNKKLTSVILIAGFVIFSLTYFMKHTHNIENNNDSNINQKIVPVKHNGNNLLAEQEQKTTVNPQKQNKSSKNTNSIRDDLYQDLSFQKYSDDPIVEFTSIALEFANCTKMARRDTRKYYNQYFNTSHKLQAQIEKLSQSCDELKVHYPTIINFDKHFDSKMLILSLASSSKYASLIQRGIGFRQLGKQQENEFIFEVFVTILHSENAQLITLLSELAREPQAYSEILPIAGILNTINVQYLKLISEQAIVLVACQYNNGITCSDTGSYMLKICSHEEKACGVDVKTWFATNHTDAHNRDIKIVFDYFNAL